MVKNDCIQNLVHHLQLFQAFGRVQYLENCYNSYNILTSKSKFCAE